MERAKKTVEDAARTPVNAFLAQGFSILAGNLCALEILHEVGFEIDSSIFPMRSRHYGIANWRLEPHCALVDVGARILEVPVAIWSLGWMRLPVAGGGYFRALPRRLIARGFRSIATIGRPGIVYCHPYEFNNDELAEYQHLPGRLRFSQEIGRSSFADRVHRLTEFPFGRFTEVLTAGDLG